MKTTIKTLALVLLVGLFGSSCAALDRINAEYEEEAMACETLSPDAKAECLEVKHEREKINWNEYIGGGD
jgi:hypothetical protein